MPVNPVLDATGLTVLRTAEVRSNMIEAIQSSPAFGENAQVGADHALGQLIDIPADQIGLAYELLQELFDAWSPAGAVGIQLDNLALLLGLPREPATASRVQLHLTGTPFGTMPDPGGGRRARVPDGTIFRFYGAVNFDNLGDAYVNAEATETGPLEAPAGTVTEIVDSHPDWTGVTNPGDASVGENIESDSEYRQRRARDLTRLGRSTDQALRVALELLDSVTAATVISNRTLTTDPSGLPGKSFEPIVWPDSLSPSQEEEIFTIIWNHTPTGISSHGSRSAEVIDSQGVSQTVAFSYASREEIWIEVDVTDKDHTYGGDDAVREAVVAYGQSLNVGDDVLPDGIRDYIMPTDGAPLQAVGGVRALAVRVKAGGAPGPGDTVPVVMSLRQYAEIDSARITVTS